MVGEPRAWWPRPPSWRSSPAATSAFAVLHKTVTVDVDGTSVEVEAFGRTVGDMLASADIAVGDRDLVAPALRPAVSRAGQIVVRHGHELSVEVDGIAARCGPRR